MAFAFRFRLRGRFGCFLLFLAFLIGSPLRAGLPADFNHPYSPVSVNGRYFKGGDTVVVNVSITNPHYSAGFILGVPYAESATLNGEPAPRDGRSYYDHYFDFNPHPNPTGPMYFIALPAGVGSHTATFKLKKGVVAKHTSSVDSRGITQTSGPYVICDLPYYQMFATLIPIEIGTVTSKVKVTKNATAAREAGAKPEEEVTFNVNATAEGGAKSISVEDEIPKGSDLVEGSLTGGGTVKGRKIQWKSDGGPAGGSYKVKLGTVRELPRNPEALVSTATATAKFKNGNTEKDSARSFVRILFPWRIKGQVRDIAFNPAKGPDVNFPGVGGQVVELLGPSGSVVDSGTTDGGGNFRVFASDPGTHKLRVSGSADALAGDDVAPGGAALKEEREVEIASGDPPDKVFKQDVFFPRSLHDRVVAQLVRLRKYEALRYQFGELTVSDSTLQSLINGWVPPLVGKERYDVAAAAALLAKARTNGFVNTSTGKPAVFEGLFNDGDQRDGWNAVLRLSAFLETLDERQRSFGVMSQLSVKAVCIMTSAFAIQKSMAAISKSQGWGDPTVKQNVFTGVKVSVMAFGMGLLLPTALEFTDVSPQTKERIIEVSSKIARYSLDVIGLAIGATGSGLGDIGFEIIFNVIRIGGTLEMGSLYKSSTQQFLDGTCSSLSSGVYRGSTRQALRYADEYRQRFKKRTQFNIARLADFDLKILSFVRGMDGFLFNVRDLDQTKWAKALQGFLGNGAPLYETDKWGRIKTDKNGKPVPAMKEVIGKNGQPISVQKKGTPLATTAAAAIYADIIATTMWEWVFRHRELLWAQWMVETGELPGALLSLSKAAPREERPAPSVRSTPSGDLSGEYRKALADLRRAILDSGTAGYAAQEAAVAAAHAAYMADVEADHRRILAAIPGLEGKKRNRAEAFAEEFSALLLQVANTYNTLELLLGNPDRAARKIIAEEIQDLRALIQKVAARAKSVGAILEAGDIPPAVFLETGPEPNHATVLAGQNFAIAIVAYNPGDSATEAQTITLSPGFGVTLVGAASQPLPSIPPGGQTTVSWTAKIAPSSTAKAISFDAIAKLPSGPTAYHTDFFIAEP